MMNKKEMGCFHSCGKELPPSRESVRLLTYGGHKKDARTTNYEVRHQSPQVEEKGPSSGHVLKHREVNHHNKKKKKKKGRERKPVE